MKKNIIFRGRSYCCTLSSGIGGDCHHMPSKTRVYIVLIQFDLLLHNINNVLIISTFVTTLDGRLYIIYYIMIYIRKQGQALVYTRKMILNAYLVSHGQRFRVIQLYIVLCRSQVDTRFLL